MFGIHGYFGDLVFEPKLMEEQFDANGRASVEFVFAGRKLRIIYVKSKDVSSEMRVRAGGKNFCGNCIPRKELVRWDAEELHEIFVEGI